MQDAELLRVYVANGDEAAFTELVKRHVDLVYSTALRHLDNSHLAQETAQVVFLLLAQKAGRLTEHPTLAGWLYRTTSHVAERARRSEQRRQARELQAAQMNTNEPDDADAILALLDDGLKTLQDADRSALLLRFFSKKPMREVGLALGVSEAAAKMRVGRALERLRMFYTKRGVACTVAGIGSVLAERSVSAAPQTLTAQILGRLFQAGQPVASASLTTKTLILMSQTKTVAIIIGAAALLTLSFGVHRLTQPSASSDDRAPVGSGLDVRRKTAAQAGNRGPALAASDKSDVTSAAVERLKSALASPIPRSGMTWPSEEVMQALAAFPNKRAAFETLKAAVLHPEELSSENLGVADTNDLIRGRAISAMRDLAADVPEVKPFLWDLVRTGDASSALGAYMDLKLIGLKASDLPTLIERLPSLAGSPAGRRFMADGIAEVIKADPLGSAGAVKTLTGLLSSPDDHVRFSAACALATSQIGTDPRVSEMLAARLSKYDDVGTMMSVEALSKAGAKAEAFVPALLQLAKTTSEEYLRRDALRAVAAIQPSAAENIPEVREVMAADSTSRDIGTKLDKHSANLNELLGALNLPQYSTLAASQIGDLGPNAAQAVPALLHSLEGKDEDARDKILDAIFKINPQTQIDKVDSKTMTDAMMWAEISLGDRGNNFQDPVTKLVMERRRFSTWWTRDEVAGFAKKLSALDPTIGQQFIDKVIEKEPSMRQQLTAAGLPANP